jgi:hypothetical protein
MMTRRRIVKIKCLLNSAAIAAALAIAGPTCARDASVSPLPPRPPGHGGPGLIPDSGSSSAHSAARHPGHGGRRASTERRGGAGGPGLTDVPADTLNREELDSLGVRHTQ